MPKGDSLCPLGFHPQFRRPNYCKRCFREYNEHKHSGSNTSINSLSFDRESRRDEDGTNRSRSDLSSSSSHRSKYADEEKKDYSRSSYRRPMSWSAQDLRKAVDDAKEQVKASQEHAARYAYTGSRSITQDLGSLGQLSELAEMSTSSKKYSKEAEDEKKKPTFSTYLAAKSNPSARSPVSRAPSLPSESVSESSGYRSDGKPPKAPVRSKTELDFRDKVETITLSRPRKSIQCMREVKSEDADASYVIHLAPKKETIPQKEKEAANQRTAELEFVQKEAEALKKQIKCLTEKNSNLETYNKEILEKKSKFSDIRRSTDKNNFQQKNDELNEEIKKKNKEVQELKKELEKRPVSKDADKIIKELRSKLHAAEQLCEEFVDEHEENKREISTLEKEIDELQDNFREDQADEYRDLKRDLEQKAKDCRVLQFKLKKAERRTDQLEKDKDEIESKLKDLQVGETDLERTERIQLLEKEVGLAKEVSMKMHEEMEKMKSQLEVAETDKKNLKEKVQETPMRAGGKYSRSNMLGRQGSQETPEQTQRDLQDALEREQDIKEQLRYSEEETRNIRKKLSRVEDENETLQGQLSKMSVKAKRQRSMERTGSTERSSSVERGTLSRQGSAEKPQQMSLQIPSDDLDPTDLKIQLELNEQEVVILRRKVECLESENIRLQKELKGFICNSEPKKAQTIPTVDPSKSTLLLNKTIRTLEQDLQDQKKKITEIEKERDQLQVDLTTARKRAKITRNRSLEQTEVDDKKKTESFEKEIAALRQKCITLEGEKEKFQEEIKVLQVKVSYRKPPFSVQDKLGIANQVLSDKIKMLEKKLLANGSIDEKDVVTNNLDYDVKLKDLQDKIGSLQVELKSIKKDNEEMKSSTPYKDRKAKIPKDTTPKITLFKWVNELENECAKLNSKLKLNETEIEALHHMGGKQQERKASVDSEMCHLLFFECDSLRGETASLKEQLATKDSELKEMISKVTELQEKFDNENISAKPHIDGWVPPKLTELTPKATLRKIIEDLCSRHVALYAAMQDADMTRGVKGKDESSIGLRDSADKLQKEKERNAELSRQLQEERTKTAMNHVKSKTSASKEDEEKVKKLQQELDGERLRLSEIQNQIAEGTLVNFEKLRQAQTDKHKLQKELSASQQNAAMHEKKCKDSEETLKMSEKAERNLRNLLDKAEQRLDDERNSQYTLEERQKEMSVSWLTERDDLKREITEIKRSKESLEKEMKVAQKSVKLTEERMLTEKKSNEESLGKLKTDKDRQRKLQVEKENLQMEYNDLRETISSIEKEKEKVIRKHAKDMDGQAKENEDLKIRMATLETEVKTEKKKRERLEKDNSIGLRGKTSEIIEYRDRLLNLEKEKVNTIAELDTLKMDYSCLINDLNTQIKDKNKDLQHHKSIISTLEEEIKQQNSQIQSSQDKTFSQLKKDYETIEGELKTLRETYNLHKDTWIKEKLNMQMQNLEMEDMKRKNGDGSSYSEKQRLMSIIEDKQQQIDNIKIELDTTQDQLSYYKKETDNTKKKIEDLERLQDIADKRQSSVIADNKEYEARIRDLKSRLLLLEKTGKSETTKMKMRYDTKIKALTEEVTTLTHHMTKYRRERDTYKEMLDGAQKTIAELKGNSSTPYRTSRADNATEIAASSKRLADHQAKTHLNEILDLQGQITDMEDRLADSRMEVTKLRNEAVDQKTSFEIQLCDMQTKINEYEEDRLLSGGGRKVAGLRTRLELNWQREREDQQRLLQETSILAKDLRQTLYEVERERDMERLDAKRKIDHLKKTVSMEHQDTKGKVQELQSDIRDLREAHAKLRQINEKLRKDKDRTSLEREAMRDKFLGSSRDNLNQQAKMEKLLENVYKVKDLSPLVIGESIDDTGTPLKNVALDNNPRTKEQFTSALKGLARHSEDLKHLMGLGDERDRMRRTPSFRKALSAERDDGRPHSVAGHHSRGAHRPIQRGVTSHLHRKAQSLDHQLADEKGKIWVSSEAGSTSSIESARTEDMKRAAYEFSGSLDRMSTGSQTSDLDLTAEKRKGLRGMLSKFGKAKSIEDTHTAGSIVGVGVKALAPGMSGSGSGFGNEDPTVTDKIKTFFKKVPSSRSKSSERENLNGKKLTKQNEEPSVATTTSPLIVIHTPEICQPSPAATSSNTRRILRRSTSFGTNN